MRQFHPLHGRFNKPQRVAAKRERGQKDYYPKPLLPDAKRNEWLKEVHAVDDNEVRQRAANSSLNPSRLGTGLPNHQPFLGDMFRQPFEFPQCPDAQLPFAPESAGHLQSTEARTFQLTRFGHGVMPIAKLDRHDVVIPDALQLHIKVATAPEFAGNWIRSRRVCALAVQSVWSNAPASSKCSHDRHPTARSANWDSGWRGGESSRSHRLNPSSGCGRSFE
jgi:hypothetical protein